MARVLTLKPGAKRCGWLLSRERDAAGVVLDLIDEAMRKDVVAQALNDEYCGRFPGRLHQRATQLGEVGVGAEELQRARAAGRAPAAP